MTNNHKDIIKYKDGSTQGIGSYLNGQMHGFWEFYRKDGSKMRTGQLDMGKQTSEWITYDRKGNVVKITNFK